MEERTIDKRESEILAVLKHGEEKDGSGYQLHFPQEFTVKLLQNVFAGFKLPPFLDDIVAVWDISPFRNWKEGALFLRDGFFVTRLLKTSYYVKYGDIEQCEVDKNGYLNLTLKNGDSIQASCYRKEQSLYLQNVLLALEKVSRNWETDTGNAGQRNEPVKCGKRSAQAARGTQASAAQISGPVKKGKKSISPKDKAERYLRNQDRKQKISVLRKQFEAAVLQLSEPCWRRFAADLGTLNSLDGSRQTESREAAGQALFWLLAQYAIVYGISAEQVVPSYGNYVKAELALMENRLCPDSRAHRYYKRFQGIRFDENAWDFEDLTEFVELFLGLYNRMAQAKEKHSVETFSFGIAEENPDRFFEHLQGKRKNGKLQLKKDMIRALTSLACCHALEKEGEA